MWIALKWCFSKCGLYIICLLKCSFLNFTQGLQNQTLKERLKILHFNKLPRCTLNFENHSLKENTSLILEFYIFEALNTKFSLIGRILVNFPEAPIWVKSGYSGWGWLNCRNSQCFPSASYCAKELENMTNTTQILPSRCLQSIIKKGTGHGASCLESL